MTSTNPKALEKIKHQAKKHFEQSNPKTWGKFAGDAEKIAQARKIEERALVIRKKIAEHCKKHRSEWVAKETVIVFEEYQKPILKHPKPNWALDQPANVSYTEEARKRVQRRIQTRIKRVGKIERNMQARITQDMEPRQKCQLDSQMKTPALRQNFNQSMG